jgi:RNA polymerase sigma-70 factor (ECF subfamily)
MTDFEQRLIQECRAGDRRAFDRLVLRYQPVVHACCRRFTSDAAEVQDLTQETFLRVYEDLHQLREVTRFPFWLRQVARRVCMMWKRRQRPWEPGDTPGEAPEADPPERRSPEQEAMQRELRSSILRAIGRLPEEQQLVVTLYYLDNWSYREMAEVLALSEATIKIRLHRARRRLKGALLREFAVEARRPGQSALVARALSGLTADERTVVHLRYRTGLTHQEIGAWLDMPVVSVCTTLFQARRRLQKRLLTILEEVLAREQHAAAGGDMYLTPSRISRYPGESRVCV